MTASRELTAGTQAALSTIERYQPAVMAELRAVLEDRPGPPYSLMRYHLGWEDESGAPVEGRGGKMLRPALCLLACEGFAGSWDNAVPAAAAIELLHNFTLIHDDVEDASEQRHGRPTLWSLWGDAQAINAGDGMFALAYATLLRLSRCGHDPDRVLQSVRMLDDATLHLCEGQHRDLLAEGGERIHRAGYFDIIEGKTAALLAASSALGALLGGASEDGVDALFDYGRHTGLAFQIRDDVLGIWGDAGETGKPASDDLRAGKQSFPVVIALDGPPSENRDMLAGLLAQNSRDDAEIETARSLLEALGVRQECQRVASEHADAAVASIDRITMSPDSRVQLAGIATFAATRNA